MRPHVKEFVKICADLFENYFNEPIYEFGSKQYVESDPAELRTIFKQKKYIGVDMLAGIGVDRIENLENLTINSGEAGSVLIMDTIEHVRNIKQATEELIRVLSDNGIIVLSSTMYFPIHSYPYDYWRFTPECIKALLEPLPCKIVGYHGWELFPHTIYGIGFKKKIKNKEWMLIKLKKHYIENGLIQMTALRKIRKLIAGKLYSKNVFNEIKYINKFDFKVYQ